MGTWQLSSWNLRSLFSFTRTSQVLSSRKLDISNSQFYHIYSPLIDDNKVESRITNRWVETHTVWSHGIVVARTHMYDWLVLIVLAVLIIVLNCISPFYRYVGKDMMMDLSYPLKDNTIPLWAVPVYAILLPSTVFLAFYFHRRDVYDLHHAILGLLFSVLITGVITDAIKDAVGRPRPDFFWRCFPDGKDLYDRLGNVICHGDSNVVREGHKSFPSGHTSWSFSGLGFLSLYLSGKLRIFYYKGQTSKLCIVVLPLLVASLVGISRVDDYWHHWQDVFAGGVIGITMAMFCYLQFFAPPYSVEGWGPYAYFRAIEKSHLDTQDPEPSSAAQTSVLSVEIHVTESSLDNPHLTLDDHVTVIR